MEENKTTGGLTVLNVPKDHSLVHSSRTYTGKGIYGVTDLWAEDPWNTDFGNWPTFYGHFDVTEEEYDKDPTGYAKRVRTHNKTYISELKANGKYNTEYTFDISMVHNPIFDEPGEGRVLESYRMVFLDSEEFDGQSNIKIIP
jgi:hypothetical protein